MRRTRVSRRTTVLRQITTAGAALAGADIGLRLGGKARVRVGPSTADVRLTPNPAGGSVVHVPPAGDATLATHRGPLRVEATVTELDEAQVRTLVGSPTTDGLRDDAQRAAVDLGVRAALSVLAGAGAGGALIGRTARDGVTGAAIGIGALAAAAGYAWRTRDLDAWRTPELSGLLTRLPGIIGDVQQIPQQLARYRTQVGEITASVTGLYRGLTSLPGASTPPSASTTGTITAVWVSDIHNNPIAFDVVRALVQQYDAALVIDSGDINDWGTTGESRTYADISKIPVPYVFIKGNHDGPGTLKEITKHDNVTVLAGGTPHEVAGLRLAGDADPRFTPDKSTGDDRFSKERLVEIGRELAPVITEAKPDIAVVHDPVVARQLGGTTPLVLCGHTHRRRDERAGETIVLTQGSSGGAGLRGIRADPPAPLEVSVLHFDAKSRRLVAVDEVTVGGLGRTEASVVRRDADDLGTPESTGNAATKAAT